jgi:FlgN protein
MTETNFSWENEIAGLLTELSRVQSDLLDVLRQKRELLVAGDEPALALLSNREADLLVRLQACQQRRQDLLDRAAGEGLPAGSIRSLSKSLPNESRSRMQGDIDATQHRSRILQHECLTNWVLVQRTLLHLSQLVEIIATGGRMKPTYGNGTDCRGHRPDSVVGGALVDRAV